MLNLKVAKRAISPAGWALAAALIVAAASAQASSATDCHIGSYRLQDGGLIDIAPSEGDTLRWRRLDGTTGALRPTSDGGWTSTEGWTDRKDGVLIQFSDCATGVIHVDHLAGHRISLDAVDTSFSNQGVNLAGRLVMPKGKAKAPIVVLLHGSEHDAALRLYFLQRMLPAEGVGVFVYDKRGTGQSGGAYTQDFSILADDAVAAMREARRLAGPRLKRIGYQGGSEGGWVAPLAANRAPVDFVIVSFGLAVNVIEEDQQSVEIQMREKGYSPEVIAQGQEVAHAAEKVFASGFTVGFDELDAIRARYKDQIWYKDVRGDYTWALLPYTTAQLKEMAPQYRWGTPFEYDPMPTLRANTTSQLWILGGEDYDAPSAVTSGRIKGLISAGRPFNLAYYPRAEHGMTLFETAPDGSRASTRFAPGYFVMMRDFIRGDRLKGPYGDAQLTLPPGRD
jgi:pimeloyl-ACP methyl ester carboxylesterase